MHGALVALLVATLLTPSLTFTTGATQAHGTTGALSNGSTPKPLAVSAVMVDSDDPPIAVYTGYANSFPGTPVPSDFPKPWYGDANVSFYGVMGYAQAVPMPKGQNATAASDDGAFRIDNLGRSPVHIFSVTVDLPGSECSDYGCRPVHFDRWPRDITIPPNGTAIFTETIEYQKFLAPFQPPGSTVPPNAYFDTSDYNVASHWSYTRLSNGDWHSPLITLVIGGNTFVYRDTLHILDWGGYDPGGPSGFVIQPPGFEAEPWAPTDLMDSIVPATVSPGPSLTWLWNGSSFALAPTQQPPAVGLPVRLNLTAPADGIVVLYANGVPAGSATTVNGEVTINFTPWTSGTYRLTAGANGVSLAAN